MLYARKHPTTLMLALTQVLQGAGGGIVAVATQVGAQGAVQGSDLAMATASVLLFAEMGNVTGQSIASAINVQYLPKMITSLFPQFSVEEVAQYVGDPSKARHLGVVGSLERQKMIEAFSSNMKLLTIPAALLSVIPIIASRFMRDFHLDQRRNIIETPEQLVSNHGATMMQRGTRGSIDSSDMSDQSSSDVEDGIGTHSRTQDRHFNNALKTYTSVDTLRSHANAAASSSRQPRLYKDNDNPSNDSLASTTTSTSYNDSDTDTGNENKVPLLR